MNKTHLLYSKKFGSKKFGEFGTWQAVHQSFPPVFTIFIALYMASH